MSLSGEIGDFGGLVGLLLALATLLTSNRAGAVDALARAPQPTAREKLREVALDVGIATVTFLVFLAGLPLAVRALRGLHPLAHGGPLRSVYVLSWVLLLGLVGWQLAIATRAARVPLPPR